MLIVKLWYDVPYFANRVEDIQVNEPQRVNYSSRTERALFPRWKKKSKLRLSLSAKFFNNCRNEDRVVVNSFNFYAPPYVDLSLQLKIVELF